MQRLFFRIFETIFPLDDEKERSYCGVLGTVDAVHLLVLPKTMPSQVRGLLRRYGEATEDPLSFGDAVEQIGEFLARKREKFTFNIRNPGASSFQKRVYKATRTIPYGSTLSYGQVAVLTKSPKAGRAVGQALGANPLPLIVPCHRVICSDGSLGGFGGGLALKRRLLDLETVSK